jgi:apolipoprotein N-acyltransferase
MKIPARYLPWIWLVIGLVLLPFTAYRNVFALAAWIAPVLLLRFVRTSRRAWTALLLVFAAYAVVAVIDEIGAPITTLPAVLFGLVFPIAAGLFFTFPYAADRVIGSRLSAWPRLLVFPMAFVAATWVATFLRAVGSFGTPAYSQYGVLPLDQIVSVTGMWGITFLIMWFASTVNALWEHSFQWRPTLGPLTVFTAVLIGVFAFGFVRLDAFAPPYQTVQAATITIDDSVLNNAVGNLNYATFNQSTDQQRAAIRPKFEATVNQMLARTQTAMLRGATLVSWQEDSAQVLAEDKQSVIDQASALAKQYNAYLDITLAVFTRTTSQQYLLNQSILISNTGTVLFTYDKSYPVFGSESIVTAAGPGILPVVATSYGSLSTYICNDAQFPALARQAGQGGAAILFAPTHEMYSFWASGDAAMATYRSIEDGFSLVRPTDDGISLITDYQGRILGSQNYSASSDGITIASVPTQGVTTIYDRIGDLFAYLCALGLVVFAGLAFAHRREATALKRLQTA